MINTTQLDMYDAACLTGGVDRAVDAAVVSLVERCQVRVRRGGQLTVVDPTPGHAVEAAVLDAIGKHGGRTIFTVRIRAGQDPRLSAITDRLVSERLLAPRLVWPWTKPSRRFTSTALGLRMQEEWQAQPPSWARPPATSAGRVALAGVGEMADQQLKHAVFGTAEPKRESRSWGHWFGSGISCGGGGGHSCGSGGSCGGGGGGCGGGGN